MLRWSILASALWLIAACESSGVQTGGGGSAGDAGTAGNGAGGTAAGSGGGDVPVCSDGPPPNGSACSPNGRTCQTAGSPCGSVHTCRSGVWASETVCPPMQQCPQALPEQGQACAVDNPVIGLTCPFDNGCGNVTAICQDARWELAPNPVTECSVLCEGVCQRLGECGITWGRDCAPLCLLAYLCPGESPGQDAAICMSDSERLSGLGCAELCSAVTDGSDSAAFGVDCDFSP